VTEIEDAKGSRISLQNDGNFLPDSISTSPITEIFAFAFARTAVTTKH